MAVSQVPDVSVIIPVGRLDRFVLPAINSCLSQTLSNIEVIVVCNSGITVPEVAKLLPISDRIVLVETPLHGISNALNVGLALSKSEFIARMDADDICHSSRFEVQKRFLDRFSSVVAVGSFVSYLDQNDVVTKAVVEVPVTDAEIRFALAILCPFIHPTVMMRRSAILSIGGYGLVDAAEDYDLWLRLARKTEFEFANIDQVLLSYRRHSTQLTRKDKQKWSRWISTSLKLREYLITRRIGFLVAIIIPDALLVRIYRLLSKGLRRVL